jgi:hypothetical protein
MVTRIKGAEKEQAGGGVTTYAVNLADLAAIDSPVVRMLIVPHISSRQTVEVERRRVDGTAVVLACPEAQAAAIVEVIRLRIPRHRLRCYRSTGENRWTRW